MPEAGSRQPVEQASGQADADDDGQSDIQTCLCACVQLGGLDLVVLVILVVLHGVPLQGPKPLGFYSTVPLA